MKDPDRLGSILVLRQTRAGQEMQAKGDAGKEWELHLKSMMKMKGARVEWVFMFQTN
jgi:hypothetical protein